MTRTGHGDIGPVQRQGGLGGEERGLTVGKIDLGLI
jgi:hypothetical protein